jgi:diguanylate cyclase (GGDEF)-like protein
MISTVKTKTPSPKGSLFVRVLTVLNLPLFFLGIIFIVIQLTNQVHALNLLHRIEGRFAFEALEKILSSEIKLGGDPEKLAKRFKGLEESYGINNLSLYNYLEQKPVLPETESEWSEADQEKIELSLRQKELGKNYYVVINKKAKKLITYIPVYGTEESQIYIAKAHFPLAGIKQVLDASRLSLGIMIFFMVLIGAVISILISNSIVKPIQLLNQATQEIRRGNLGSHVKISTGDEIEALAETFNQMSDSLQEMTQRAVDSNPLTGLPGNHAIFSNLQKRIFERQKFVLFHADLNLFKIFNDHYGLVKGDLAIRNTADLLKKALAEKGTDSDFLGHQGGDDFIVITRPNKAQEVAQFVCDQFQSIVLPSLYSKTDLETGYTMHVDRRQLSESGREVMLKFPLLSIALAGVSNAKKDFGEYSEVMDMAVEVKKEVKKENKNVFRILEKS